MSYEKGQKVIKHLVTYGIETTSKAKVARVDGYGVWLFNGHGNDDSGPFDSITGEYKGDLSHCSQFIRPLS